MCATVMEPQECREACTHADSEVLGFDGQTEFMRCLACGKILIGQFGRFWILRPTK